MRGASICPRTILADQYSILSIMGTSQTVDDILCTRDPNHSRPYDFITIPSRDEHSATVVWLHGLGDSGKGMEFLAEELSKQPGLGHVKWILPHAHRMIVTAQDVSMNSWFDYISFDVRNRTEDEPGLYRAVEKINSIISAEEQDSKISSDRIIVGGFSQGSAVALLTALTTKRPLAGVFVLSGYIPLRKKTNEIASALASTLPIFWGHGCHDAQIEYTFSLDTAMTLVSDRLRIPFHESSDRLGSEIFLELESKVGLRFMTYPNMGHSLCPPEVGDLGVWMEAIIPKEASVNEG
ncbi:Acyl-protein thioesterase 1 [Hypsizygus marmoreus]|uniref:Acyl-protein thioesterase 1 n=1 Tax=Hypsizygus marmoreus TaxID=39966 RepID=A0A369J9A8_HYPMA|nr:Acyl-protein thioesterase 1 [Hypsizygus marmoreus]